jgi:hypothetical protein
MSTTLFARLGALFFAIWGVFHVYVAWHTLALAQNGIAQGRTLQFAAYMLTIARPIPTLAGSRLFAWLLQAAQHPLFATIPNCELLGGAGHYFGSLSARISSL